MAYDGSSNTNWKIDLSDEIYTGRTRISSLSSASEERSEQSVYFDNSDHSDQCDRLDNSDRSETNKLRDLSLSSNKNYRRASLNSLEVRDLQPWQPSKMEAKSKLYNYNEESSSSSSTPLSLPPAECHTYTNSKATSNSTYSYSEMYGSLNRMDNQGLCVPSLTLTSRDSAVDYLREVHRLKLDRQPQVAYEEWYATKERLRQQELQRQKMERENEMMEDELRKNLSKQCYDQWLRTKAQQAAERRMQEHLAQAAMKAADPGKTRNKPRPRRNVTQAEIRQVVESWWHKKQEQQKRQRLQRQHILLQKERDEQRRKQQAQLAWQTWIRNAYGKPKPVPMNQGLDSLRGSVSAMYINPVPWQHLKKDQLELKYQK